MKFADRHVAWLAAAALFAGLLAGCGGGSSSSGGEDADGSTSADVPISSRDLDSAASFLGAAIGKETPVSVDTVVFVNSVLGINDVPSDPRNLYGDLWVLLRDPYGIPVLDHNGCVQPVASEPVEWADGVVRDTVPMVLEEFMDGDFKCTVVEGYEEYTIELEIGRLNMVRNMANNPDGFARALEEAIKAINGAAEVGTDPAGRLVLVTDETGETVEATIDSPRENLAMYHALLTRGRIAGYGPERREEGRVVPPQWLEIDPDVNLGDLSHLREGTSGVELMDGHADLSQTIHSRQQEYQTELIPYVQYVENDLVCKYQDMEDYAWTRVFSGQGYYGTNIDAFAMHADDARRVIVFMHDVIQDLPEKSLATLPPPPTGQIDPMKLAASFLGGASNKTVPLGADGLVFINTVLDLNDADFAYKGQIFGDLWELVRDADGVPVLDANGCPLPWSSEGGTVPMELDEHGDCVVVEGYEDDVIEVELGRLNGVRVALTNPRILDRHLHDVVNSINASQGLKRDLAGRLAYGVEQDGDTVYQTVDSPRAGLALYWALMRWGKLEGEIEIMEEGQWVTEQIAITLDDAVLEAEGLASLKHGDAACQADPASCGAGVLPSDYVNYRNFAYSSEGAYSGIEVSFVERVPDDPGCGYADRTEDVWTRVLESDPFDGDNIAAFVQQAEDTRRVVDFIHTTIHDPVSTP